MPSTLSDQQALNPYAPPKTRLDDSPVEAQPTPAFFPVSLLKLAIMSLCTLGFYQIYWFYQNWKAVQRLTGDKLNAPIRAVFYPLTCFWLFGRIREQAEKVGVEVSFKAGALAIAVFVLNLLWRLPDPYGLVCLLGFAPLLPVQAAVNAINQKVAPGADSNSRFQAWNIAGLAVGGAVVALGIVGSFLGAPRGA
jgi:hypothetical protein